MLSSSSAGISRYLIIGGSGFIGSRLRQVIGPQDSVATFSRRSFTGGIKFDARVDRLRTKVLRQERFSHAFLLGGITEIDACARDPLGTALVNVEGLKMMIDDLLEAGVLPVFFSSDAVYDGSAGLRTENHKARPILTYGKQKLAVEHYLGSTGAPFLTFRLAKVVGSRPGDGSLIDQWLSAAEKAAQVRCATDQLFSPIDVDDVIAVLLRGTKNQLQGTYNLGGPTRLSRLEFLNLVLDAAGRAGIRRPPIVACSIKDFGFSEARPLDTSMSSARITHALKFHFKDMRDVAERAVSLRATQARH